MTILKQNIYNIAQCKPMCSAKMHIELIKMAKLLVWKHRKYNFIELEYLGNIIIKIKYWVKDKYHLGNRAVLHLSIGLMRKVTVLLFHPDRVYLKSHKRVSEIQLYIWPSVTDMQHFYHARYPTDDWLIAYIFSLVYFSVEVCLEGMFPHSFSTKRDPCVRVYSPLTLASPLTKKTKSNRGWPSSPLEPSEGVF